MKSSHFALYVSIFALIFCTVVLSIKLSRREEGPWYLGCVDTITGDEYLIKVDHEPRFKNGLIFIADKAFITPRPGMMCAVTEVENAPELEVKPAPAKVEETSLAL